MNQGSSAAASMSMDENKEKISEVKGGTSNSELSTNCNVKIEGECYEFLMLF